MWMLKDDSAVPPLPTEVPRLADPAAGKSEIPLLKHGCWMAQLDPFFTDDLDAELTPARTLKGWAISYTGTLRVERINSSAARLGKRMRVSGDLYAIRQNWLAQGPSTPPDLPRHPTIRIFPRKDYAFYLTVQDLALEGGEPVLTLALYRYSADDPGWGPPTFLSCRQVSPKVMKVPPGWQSAKPGRYLSWLAYNSMGTLVAKLHMGWIAHELREARVEVAVAPGLRAPLKSGKHSLTSVFEKIGWRLTVAEPIVADGPRDLWQAKDLHARMLELRSPANLDLEWLYHVLVVPRFEDRDEWGFGWMYDVASIDSNLLPREGLVIGLAARFPVDARLGGASGQPLANVPEAAFQTLVHELGHAMGLIHRFRGDGFMQALISIAEQASPESPFPENISFEFDSLDALRLRHLPDMWVRPGGAAYGQGFSSLPLPDKDAVSDVSTEIELIAKPVFRIVPLGAPVKLQLRLRNRTDSPVPGPKVLSLARGSVSGRVLGPGGQSQSFSAAAPYDYLGSKMLLPGEARFQGETLWRGPQGPLFPSPGLYRIEVAAGWVGPGGIAQSATYCEILVTAPQSRREQRLALDLLSSPDVAILLIFRSQPEDSKSYKDRLDAAVRILRKAFREKRLKAILAPIEARRLAASDLKGAAELIDASCKMTSSEIEELLRLVQEADREVRMDAKVRDMVAICYAKAARAVRKDLAPESLAALARELVG